MARVLVTGGAGFIGTATVKELLRKGYDVTVLDNLQSRVHPAQSIAHLPEQVVFIKGDVTNRADLEKALHQVDYVICLAAYQDSLPEFSKYFAVNTAAMGLLYEVIQEKGLAIEKVVYASTQAVYGWGKFKCSEHGVFSGIRSGEALQKADWAVRCPVCHETMAYVPLEEKDAEPISPYGISKHATEKFLLRMSQKMELPAVCLRYSLVQGEGQSIYNTYSGIGRIFNQQLRNGLAPQIYEDGLQIRDFVNVKDVAKANVFVMENDKIQNEVFNVGGERGVSVLEYATILANLYPSPAELQITGYYRVDDPRATFSSSAKLESYGWKRASNLQQIIADGYQWFNTQPHVNTFMESQSVMLRQGVLKKTI